MKIKYFTAIVISVLINQHVNAATYIYQGTSGGYFNSPNCKIKIVTINQYQHDPNFSANPVSLKEIKYVEVIDGLYDVNKSKIRPYIDTYENKFTVDAPNVSVHLESSDTEDSYERKSSLNSIMVYEEHRYSDPSDHYHSRSRVNVIGDSPQRITSVSLSNYKYSKGFGVRELDITCRKLKLVSHSNESE